MSLGVTLPLYTVDAFTDEPFKGNPAGVCLDSEGLSEVLMQKIAAEVNVSETAFITLLDGADSFTTGQLFGIHFYSPEAEITLCGHATLASAAILFNAIKNTNKVLTFRTKTRGDLKLECNQGKITMNLPLGAPTHQNADKWKPMVQNMFKDITFTDVQYDPLTRNVLVRLDDSINRGKLTAMGPPNLSSEVMDFGKPELVGVILTTKAGDGEDYDFYTRYYAPWIGVKEDPVCGSAHTVLARYWSALLDKQMMIARQLSPRGGDLYLAMKTDGTVNITGTATIVVRGTISL